MTRLQIITLLAGALTLASCGREPVKVADYPQEDYIAARWDLAERSELWTDAALAALDAHGAPLVETVPADVERYCPDYASLDDAARKAFWVNLIASLSLHESTWRPDVSAGDGRWHGLLQIAPATARGYGCIAGSASDLKVGALNVSCGIRIMTETVSRDGVISRGMRGIAADWGPFHDPEKRGDIQSYTRELPYCQ